MCAEEQSISKMALDAVKSGSSIPPTRKGKKQ
jgi:hypothetical protein